MSLLVYSAKIKLLYQTTYLNALVEKIIGVIQQSINILEQSIMEK
jgi:hypothetical protein